jgi:hypothetical protein
MWPIQLAFLLFSIWRIFLPSLSLCITYSFLARCLWSSPSFSSNTFHNLWSAVSKSAPYKAALKNLALYWLPNRNFCAAPILYFDCAAVEVPNYFNTDKANSSWGSVYRCSRVLGWRSKLLISCKPTSWRRVLLDKLVTAKILIYLRCYIHI